MDDRLNDGPRKLACNIISVSDIDLNGSRSRLSENRGGREQMDAEPVTIEAARGLRLPI